jgi:transposase
VALSQTHVTYAERRTAEGMTKTEIIRCLKRYIAREIYHALVADLLPDQPRQTAKPAVSISCGAGPIGHAIKTT